MSPSDPGLPPKSGADGPNPLELFFEKNKKWIYAIGILLVAALGVNYGLKKLERAKIDKDWREFTAVSGLAAGFSSPVELNPLPEQYRQFQAQIWGQQLAGKQRELVTELMEDIQGADLARIDELIAAAKDDPRVPWLMWIAANKLYAEGDWEGARARCNALKAEHPDHLLCSESQYPVQLRKEKEDPDKKKKKKDDSERKKKKVDLVDPVTGVPVDNLLAAIAADEKFTNENPHYFTPPEPDKSETAVFKLSGIDLSAPVEIEIAFYPDAAKKHVEAFKKSVSEGYYKGMRIHKIKRAPKAAPGQTVDEDAPRTIHLGNPNSKEDDRTKWNDPGEAKDEDILEFETGTKKLSFFPMMVAAEQEKDGKSSARRFFICANDCAASYDGEYVIFGRVIRGAEHVQDVASGDMADEAEESRGEGRPVEDIRVESTELKKQ